jgi:hypothetical protein
MKRFIIRLAWLLLIFTMAARNSPAATNNISPGQTIGGRIALLGQVDYLLFSANSNDAVTVFLGISNAPICFFPVLQLLDTNGDLLVTAGGIDCNTRDITGLHLPRTGTYTIVVRDDGGNESFTYGLSLIKMPGSNATDAGEAGVIAPGQTVAGRIGAIADLDVYTFPAVAGDTVTTRLSTTDGDGQYSVLQLHAPDGTVLVDAPRGVTSASIRYVCLPQTGTYFLLCRDDGGNQISTYTLSFAQTPGPPPINAPPEFLQAFMCTSNRVVVRWSMNATGFRLQSTTELREPPSAIIWSNIPGPYPAMQEFHFVTNSVPPTRRFFRLISP